MTAPKKIVFADTDTIEQYEVEVKRILFVFADFMIEEGEDPAEWVESVFVSDESCIGDFIRNDDQLQIIADRLGLFSLRRSDFVRETAAALRQMERRH